MTKYEAATIIKDLLNDSGNMLISERIDYFESKGYKEIADVYSTYMSDDMSARWFMEEAEKALIVSHTKLGRALK